MNDWIIGMLVFLYGLAIGSFLNVVIYRMPLGQSFVVGRSFCPSCQHQLSARDLVPLFSYLAQFGKCRYCKAPISARYPLVELLNGLLFFLVYKKWGLTIDALFDAILLSAILVAALIDYDTHKIPNRLNAFVALLALVRLSINFSRFSAVLPGILLMIAFFALVLGLSFLLKRTLFGMGDIKLLLALSLYFDYSSLLVLLAIAFSVAGLMALMMFSVGEKSLHSRLPMGPYFAIATVLTVLYGDLLILFIK
ncbi:MAG: prepilin peptidase [Clostridiales bacterium]|nr:MAG: prepilin peptidase [Clostridiales bacterium]